MSRKSNKTEHVLKLITKNQEPDEEKEVHSIVDDDKEEVAELKEEATEEVTEDNDFEEIDIPENEPIVEDEIEVIDDENINKNETDFNDQHEVLKERLKEELREELREVLKEELKVSKEEKVEVEVVKKEPEEVLEEKQEEVEDKSNPSSGGHKVNPPIVRELGNIGVVNLTEVLVLDLLGDIMKKMNVCECDLCKADVIALALNFLPQKYVTTNEGKQFMQLDIYRKQYETDVLSALTRACVRVKASPRHS